MLKIILAPLLGAIIGYITNDLAIRMLFRPRRAMYIGKFHIPFTPGLIPSQKSRIANSIGKMISGQLLNADTLKQTILSEKTVEELKDRLRGFFRSLNDEKRTVNEILEQHFSEEQIRMQTENVEKRAAEAITARLSEANVGSVIVEAGVNSVLENEAANRLTAFFVDSGTKENIKQRLADKINQVIAAKAPDIICHEIDKMKEDVMDTPVCEIYVRYQDKEDAAVNYISDLYVFLLENNLEKFLEAVNIERIVVEKINSFDAAQLEAMIFGIMKRELKAIVYLGAALGFLMGFVNLLY